MKKDKRKMRYEGLARGTLNAGDIKSLYDVYQRPSDVKRHAWAIIEEERNIYKRRDGDIVSKVFILTHSAQFFTCCFLYLPKTLSKNDFVMKIHTPYDSWITHVDLTEQQVASALDDDEYFRWRKRSFKGELAEGGIVEKRPYEGTMVEGEHITE